MYSSWRGVEAAGGPEAEAVEIEIDDRRGEEREHLADDQAADDGDAERAAQFGAGAGAERQGQAAEQRRHGGHHDGAEAQQAGLVDRVLGRSCAVVALGLEGEVDHHDGVLLDDADEQDDADQGDDAEIGAGEQQGASSAPTPAEGRVERIVRGWM